MDELRVQSPELAEQIYVFNSFFYNKLTSVPKKSVPFSPLFIRKANEKMSRLHEGYANVRKWTSKSDLFSKKYIVVPINEKYASCSLGRCRIDLPLVAYIGILLSSAIPSTSSDVPPPRRPSRPSLHEVRDVEVEISMT
jgi:hypothetical protein